MMLFKTDFLNQLKMSFQNLTIHYQLSSSMYFHSGLIQVYLHNMGLVQILHNALAPAGSLLLFYINIFTASMIWPIPSCFQLSYQLHNSLGDCAKELFKPSKDSTSLRVCNDNKFFGFEFGFFVSDVISGIVLGLFGPFHLALGLNR